MDSVLAYTITAILGGGFFKGLEAIYRAINESKEKKKLADVVGAKTPAEIESVSVATMTRALESAQHRISSLELERESDRDYYQERIRDMSQQLQRVRDEMHAMELKLSSLLAETDGPNDRKVNSSGPK